AVLAGVGALRDVDELDAGLVKGALVVAVAAPVGVRLLDDDLALFQQPLEHHVDVEVDASVARADGNVFEIAEDGQLALLVARGGAFGDGGDDLADQLLQLRHAEVDEVAGRLLAARRGRWLAQRPRARRLGRGARLGRGTRLGGARFRGCRGGAAAPAPAAVAAPAAALGRGGLGGGVRRLAGSFGLVAARQLLAFAGERRRLDRWGRRERRGGCDGGERRQRSLQGH